MPNAKGKSDVDPTESETTRMDGNFPSGSLVQLNIDGSAIVYRDHLARISDVYTLPRLQTYSSSY